MMIARANLSLSGWDVIHNEFPFHEDMKQGSNQHAMGASSSFQQQPSEPTQWFHLLPHSPSISEYPHIQNFMYTIQ